MSEILPRSGMILFPLIALADILTAFAQGRWPIGLSMLAVSASGLFASIQGYLYQATREPGSGPETQMIQHEMHCPACRRMHFVSDYGIRPRR